MSTLFTRLRRHRGRGPLVLLATALLTVGTVGTAAAAASAAGPASAATERSATQVTHAAGWDYSGFTVRHQPGQADIAGSDTSWGDDVPPPKF